MAYRDESGVYGLGGGGRGTYAERVRGYVEQAGSLDSGDEDDEEWADTDVPKPVITRGPDGKLIRVVEDTPDWFEKYTSFLCLREPDVILQTLETMLACDDKIAFESVKTHYQITGSVTIDEQTAKFHINIFRDTMPGEYLVEFQRQGGNQTVFQALYRQCLVHLNNAYEDFIVEKFQAIPTGVFNFTTPKADA